MKKIFKYFGYLLLAYTSLCLITPFNGYLKKRSIENQISYLSNLLDEGYDDELQIKYPEGKLFSNAILALSVIEHANITASSEKEYANIVDNCIRRIQSENALAEFDSTLDPQFGMFYNGWSNYVYSSYIKSKLFNISSIQDEVNNQSKIIEERLIATQKDSLKVLDSYLSSNWPADNMIGIISLRDSSLKKNWIETIINTSKHNSGMIHHSGSNKSEIRGSSTAMITFCLDQAEFENIDEYNNDFKNIFVDELLNIQLVKENEDGSDVSDIDSGPILFGYGASATIMNIKTQASLENTQSKYTWAAMNTISMPINIFKKKFYLFKKEPMLDLFMLWGSTSLE